MVIDTLENEYLEDSLDDLLSESLGIVATVAAGKDTQKRLRQGRIRTEDQEDALAAINAMERIQNWEDVGDIAVVEVSQCICNNVTKVFVGYFTLQRHRREAGARRVLKTTSPTSPKLYHVAKLATVCGICLIGDQLSSLVTSDFPILQQFSQTGV